MKKYYLAYGSNMNLEQMKRRCHEAIALGTIELKDYRLIFKGNNGNGVATIEKHKGDSIPLVLWSISKKCEQSLDRYEGYPFFYKKRNFEVNYNGETIKAMVYIMAPGFSPSIPSAYYFDVIKAGYNDFNLDTAPLYKALSYTKEKLK